MTEKRKAHTIADRLPMFGGVVMFATWALIILWLCFTPIRPYLPAAIGVKIESLGQLGDAFGPLTSFFALIAAVGAWRSYQAQQEQLDDERGRNRVQRFDDLFFRLLDYYQSALDSIAERRVVPGGSWPSFGLAEESIPARTLIGLFFNEDESAAAIEQNASKRWFDSVYGESRFTGLSPLAAQIPAMLSWLERERIADVEPYGRLLCARLSDSELWFWQRAIAARASNLIDFAQEMQIFGEGGGPPKFIGTGRGMTVELAKGFVLSGVDRYTRPA
jgi:hypothetical protein